MIINTWCCGLPVKGTACFKCERTIEEIVDGAPSEKKRRRDASRARTTAAFRIEIKDRLEQSLCNQFDLR